MLPEGKCNALHYSIIQQNFLQFESCDQNWKFEVALQGKWKLMLGFLNRAPWRPGLNLDLHNSHSLN